MDKKQQVYREYFQDSNYHIYYKKNNMSSGVQNCSLLNSEDLESGWFTKDNKLYVSKENIKSYLVDKHNLYNINHLGFRSKKFTNKKVDFLISGCSITFGLGIPEELIWAVQSIDSDNYVNLSVPGQGTEAVVFSIFKYIQSYGAPKKILCLFPDFGRITFATDLNFHISKNNNNFVDKDKNLNFISTIHLRNIDGDGNINRTKENLNFPLYLEDVISVHESIRRYIYNIYLLQEFCSAAKIDFLWSTWDYKMSNVLTQLWDNGNFILNYENYVQLNFKYNTELYKDKIIIPLATSCKDDHNHIMKDSLFWNHGTDLIHFEPGYSIHPGVHWHYHTADAFKNKI